MLLINEMKKSSNGNTKGVAVLSLGSLRSVLECARCSQLSSNIEEFNCLSLQIPVGVVNLSMAECLQGFFQEELIPMEDG